MKSAVETLRATLLTGAALVLGALPLPAFAAGQGPEADYPVLIGDAYAIGGVTYTPADTLNYDAVGYAHAASEGAGISGAHHTLPIPCYVEVTALDSGKTILVRLDRRGPMTGKQLIELSPAAWAQLGIPGATDAPVRVRRVNPPEPERAALRTGSHAPDRMDTPPGLLSALRRKLGLASPQTPDEPPSATLSPPPPASAAAPRRTMLPPRPLPVSAPPANPASQPLTPPPAPVAGPPPPPAVPTPAKPAPAKPALAAPAKPAAPVHPAEGKTIIVQVAAFSSEASARRVAHDLGGVVEASGKVWRVRIHAADQDAARAALAKAKKAGYATALILHHG